MGTETKDPATLPMQTASVQLELTFEEAGLILLRKPTHNMFPCVPCGLCVVHIIGFQDVKCHPRTEPGKEWAECLLREL